MTDENAPAGIDVTHARFWNHDAADLATMLDGLEPVGPGVCEARR